jgi:hypothetical protein
MGASLYFVVFFFWGGGGVTISIAAPGYTTPVTYAVQFQNGGHSLSGKKCFNELYWFSMDFALCTALDVASLLIMAFFFLQ